MATSTDRLVDEFIPAQGRNVVYGFRNPAYWQSGEGGLLEKKPDIAEGVPAFRYRPAQIVRVWTTSGVKTVNLIVFLDGSNDKELGNDDWIVWKTSVVIGTFDDKGFVAGSNEHYLPRIPAGASITA